MMQNNAHKGAGIHFFLSVDDTFHVILVISYIAKKVFVATRSVKSSKEFFGLHYWGRTGSPKRFISRATAHHSAGPGLMPRSER